MRLLLVTLTTLLVSRVQSADLEIRIPNDELSQQDGYTSSPSNNIYAHLIQQRFKQTIVSAKNGGANEARKRVLAQLPISAQSYSPSPFLDLSLFSYDDKWVSVMERPKACGERDKLVCQFQSK